VKTSRAERPAVGRDEERSMIPASGKRKFAPFGRPIAAQPAGEVFAGRAACVYCVMIGPLLPLLMVFAVASRKLPAAYTRTVVG
jgi:hypothetical protein